MKKSGCGHHHPEVDIVQPLMGIGGDIADPFAGSIGVEFVSKIDVRPGAALEDRRVGKINDFNNGFAAFPYFGFGGVTFGNSTSRCRDYERENKCEYGLLFQQTNLLWRP